MLSVDVVRLQSKWTMLSSIGSHVDALCWQYPGVWPNFGEDMETLQGLHTASA